MNKRPTKNRPYVGRYYDYKHDKRIPLLKGDWSDPPATVPSNIQRLYIFSSESFVSSDTNFLSRFPRLHTVRLSIDQPIDLSGLYQLPALRDLTIRSGWMDPKHLVLDLTRLPKLRRLWTPFSLRIRGWEHLDQLTELHLDHINGIKRLDLSHHPRLQTLDLGPANGVEEVCLSGIASLRVLTLACMSRLSSLVGSAFYDTVTALDIRASNRIPTSLLARFTQLKTVELGMKSTLTADNFPLCSPRISHSPV